VREASQEDSSPSEPQADPTGAPENGGEPGGELAAMRQALASAEESVRTQRDLYLRAAAELDNVRKRAQRDVENAHRYAIEGLAAELLAVRDGLELGIRNGATADARTLLEGQEAARPHLR
jgi:molecular chaperone GrpE